MAAASKTVAASTEDTVKSQDFQGILKQIQLRFNGNDSTGSLASEFVIEIDGTEIIRRTFNSLETYFANETGTNRNPIGLFHLHESNSSTKVSDFTLIMDTEVTNNLTIKVDNADATNTTAIKLGFIYDQEI